MAYAVARCLAGLGERHPSTARAYRWALTDLATAWGDEPLTAVLSGPGLGLWATSPTGAGREPSAASVRQRATAARTLVQDALDAGLVDAGTAATAVEALRRPATPPVARDLAPARVLLALVAGRRPHGVSWHVWVRFRAHVLLLAGTGAPERELGRAALDDLALDGATLRVAGERYRLGASTRHAVTAWVPVRAGLVAQLEGTPPAALWVRAHPSVHPRTGVLAPVGLPITARGLRKAFQDVVAGLAGVDPRVATCTVAHVRALARDDAPPGPDVPGPATHVASSGPHSTPADAPVRATRTTAAD